VILLERIERPGTDIAFKWTFTKARERTPENRADFEPAIIVLADDQWLSERGGDARKAQTGEGRALELLKEAITREGIIPKANSHIPPDTQCINEDTWRRYHKAGCISENSPDAERKAFKRATDKLVGKKVGKWNEWVWVFPA
jgi:hypothetical protein